MELFTVGILYYSIYVYNIIKYSNKYNMGYSFYHIIEWYYLFLIDCLLSIKTNQSIIF